MRALRTTLMVGLSIIALSLSMMIPTAAQSEGTTYGYLVPIDYQRASDECSPGPCRVYDNGWLTVEGQLQDIDAMWRGRFETAGIEYRSPQAYAFDGAMAFQTGGCGDVDPGAFALYCGEDETLYLNTEALDQVFVDSGAYAVTNVIAHEFGHHIQHLTDVEPESVELQANCLVGVYWADADSRELYPADFSQGSLDYMGAGDPDNYDPAYGSPADQQDQWMTGYNEGSVACGLPL